MQYLLRLFVDSLVFHTARMLLVYQQSGVASIASGAPGQYQSMVTPNPTPLQTALGIASVGGGLLGNYGDYLRGRNA